jgi:hypothetical protein
MRLARPTRWTRPPALGLLLALAGCADLVGSGDLTASFSLAPAFAPGTVTGVVSVDNVRLRLLRPVAELALDTTVVFPADSSRLAVRLRVPLRARSEKFLLLVELREGAATLFSATQTVELIAESEGPTPTPQPVLVYVGPGAAARALRIEPRDTVLTFGASFQFRVSGTDASGTPVNDLRVIWNAPQTVSLSTDGTLLAPGARGIIKLRAFTPSGVGDSTSVRFAPAPASLVLQGGGGQNATAGSTLPVAFAVQVRGADGLGVPGVVVHFRSLTLGAAVGTASMVTGDNGSATTTLTLGILAGVYSFEAAVSGLPVVVVNALAVP